MPSGRVHPSGGVVYLCHLLVEATNGPLTEQHVLHHPAWRSKVGRKRRQREGNSSNAQSRRTTWGTRMEVRRLAGDGGWGGRDSFVYDGLP